MSSRQLSSSARRKAGLVIKDWQFHHTGRYFQPLRTAEYVMQTNISDGVFRYTSEILVWILADLHSVVIVALDQEAGLRNSMAFNLANLVFLPSLGLPHVRFKIRRACRPRTPVLPKVCVRELLQNRQAGVVPIFAANSTRSIMSRKGKVLTDAWESAK